MKKILLLPMIAALSMFSACNKPQSDAERQAEIDRQVQQKLDAEHQAQAREELARREGELNAREQALADKKNTRTESRERTPDRTQDRQSQAPTGDYGLFYSKLEPHGDWIETSDYGYVFHPREADRNNWRPYTAGRWVYTDAGCTWVSEEPFGWATYHYGRWIRLRNIGWVWIPGDEWAPAWVSWRKSDNYVGWAPLPPEARFDRRAGIHNWADSYYDIGPENYSFVQTREFGAQRVEGAVVPVQQNVTIVNQTTNVTNITYNNMTIVNQGPSYEEIRTRTAEPMQRVKLERDVNVNINVGEPRASLRADVVVIPAPLIPRAQAVVQKPRVVKKTVTNIIVERGWEGFKDRQAADQARAKIRSEATPPPDAPPKTFVRATETRVEATATPASSATLAPSKPQPTATVTPNEPPAAASPSMTPTASLPPVVRPRPQFVPRGAPRSTSSPDAFASPGSSATSTPINVRGPNGKLRSVRKMMEPQESPSPTASPESSPSVKPESQAQRMEPRRTIPLESPSASPSASVRSTTTPAAASPSATEPPRESKREMRREEKQERKRDRREAREGLTSPSATPTPAER